MVPPAIVLGIALSGVTMRMTRTMVLEVMRQDYVRTAWSKGLDERTVVLRHVLKNALLPVITIVGLQLPLLIGGAVVIEQIFVISGMGQLLLMAVSQRDYPVITGIFLLVGVGVMTINLLVDISYALLDPKIRQG
jgi:peptide/nickel transport system permease protein